VQSGEGLGGWQAEPIGCDEGQAVQTLLPAAQLAGEQGQVAPDQAWLCLTLPRMGLPAAEFVPSTK
jgi:hypothetical protein